MTPEIDIFEEFETCAMIYAYFHKLYGMEGLLMILIAISEEDWSKKHFMKAASELAEMEMTVVAEALAEAAANAPEPVNPFPKNTGDWRDWNRRKAGSFEGFLING